jgi:hypothetical protein
LRKTSSDASAPATVSELKRTVRPAVASVRLMSPRRGPCGPSPRGSGRR